MKISVVVPMYNESAVIANTARTLSEYMESNFEDYEIIFSDDGSADDSVKIVEALTLKNVRVVLSDRNYGKGHAVKNGVIAAEGDVIAFTDADLAYGAEVISRAAELISSSGADMLLGSRNLDKSGYGDYPAIRKLFSRVYIGVLGLIAGFRLSDSQCGFKMFTGKTAKKLFELNQTNGFAFDIENILWAQHFKYKIVEMPVSVLVHGSSSVSIVKDSIKMVRDLLRIKKRIKKSIKKDKPEGSN